MTGSANKCPNKVKRTKTGQKGPKSISDEPLFVEAHFNQNDHVSLRVSYFHISLMTGSAQKCQNRVKRDHKMSKGAKIYISRTFG